MNKLASIFDKYMAVVFFDTETTGLDASTCQIIELAAIRIEQTEHGALRISDRADLFVKLPEGQKLPEKITELTGITDDMLDSEGVTEGEAAALFCQMIEREPGERVLLVAHNAQFDLLFTREMLARHSGAGLLRNTDALDSLTVYKDRRAYPHKLANAIVAYGLSGKVQNSHRAIDDVMALFSVVVAMAHERDDLLSYVNLFGYNPKYGVSGNRIDGVTYWPQDFSNYMRSPAYTLPAKVKNANRRPRR